MYQELGLLCVLFLPVLVIYFYRSQLLDTTDNSLDEVAKKSKKKKKKSKAKPSNAKPKDVSPSQPQKLDSPSTRKDEKPKKIESKPAVDAPSRQEETGKAGKSQVAEPSKPNEAATPKVVKQQPEEVPAQKSEPTDKQQTESREVDKHMDLTPRYSRVMRITTEKEEDDWEPVPYEEGWESIGSSKKQIYSAPREVEPLSKKQRENQAKAAKKKQAKANADALQAERLRRHQKELERQKINEFYSTGAGKNTPWGKKPQKGSSKVPTSKASLNEFGQLIWD
ncbi:hypothetical protein BJV82DRAFT_612729 [Fennellomyces sp. T-0311]|nr:hypothetical protein BJV82DRAFT_612729 [Fennellomyces sp. T-0311]